MQYFNSFEDEITFDDNGDPAAVYDLVNWQMNTDEEIMFVNIGKFDGMATSDKQKLHIHDEIIFWNGNTTRVNHSNCMCVLLTVSTAYDFIFNLVFVQVPLSICSTICPPGTRKAMRPNFPVCCYDCVACMPGDISNISGKTLTIKPTVLNTFTYHPDAFQYIFKKITYNSNIKHSTSIHTK